MIKQLISGILLASFMGTGAALAATRPDVEVEADAPAIGEFDNFVFALSYQKDFCAFHPDRAECAPGTVPGGMGLHGLWPNRNDDFKNKYGYCSLSEAQVGKQWCDVRIDIGAEMSPTSLRVLSVAMPGLKSCLYNHEWYAHGSCSGLNAEDYFIESSLLTFQFWKLTSINRLINESAGKRLSREDFLQALEEDLGTGVRDSATINCRYDREAHVAYFSEIRIALDRNNYKEFPAKESLSRMKPIRKKDGTLVQDLGNCPEDDIAVSK